MLPRITRNLFLLTLTLIISTSVNAADISGKVMEVTDGNTFSLKSLSHTIKVRLVAVTPPEKGQPYADQARKHLADLILNKYVVVRYTGIGTQGYLVGRVLLEQADVNAQMLRDGVAWYYKPDADDLSESDRQLYPACEEAARAEKRGLWQDTEVLSPWEFQRREEAKATLSVVPKQNGERPTPTMGNTLATVGMLRSYAGPAIPLSRIAGNPAASPNANGDWTSVKLKDPEASISVPTNGVRNSARMPLADGRMADFEWYMVRSGKIAYVVMSASGPYSWRSPDDTTLNILNGTMDGFISGIASDFLSQGISFRCEPTPVRELSVPGFYTGRQYSLAGCTIPGAVRIYTHGASNYKMREVHLIAAFFLDGKEDANVKKFFQSLMLSAQELPKAYRNDYE